MFFSTCLGLLGNPAGQAHIMHASQKEKTGHALQFTKSKHSIHFVNPVERFAWLDLPDFVFTTKKHEEKPDRMYRILPNQKHSVHFVNPVRETAEVGDRISSVPAFLINLGTSPFVSCIAW